MIVSLKLRVRIIALVICLIIFSNIFVYAEIDKGKNILILHSYSHDYKWTDNLENGIKSIFTETDNINFDIEFMDSKTKHDTEYFEQLYNIYKRKYFNKNYDVIIASDNNALEFLLKHNDLFSNSPVVFCGINDFDKFDNINNNKYTGIVEAPDYKGTIEIAKKFNPKMKNIVVLTDSTPTGKALERDVKKITNDYKQYSFKFIQEESINEIESKISEIDKDSIVLFLLSAVRDEKGFMLVGEEISKHINNSINVPMYAPIDIWLGEGIIGGKIITGYEQGKIGGRIAKSILQGVRVEDIPIIKENESTYMFDNNILERYKIDESLIPKNSIIINKPSDFLNISKKYLYLVASFILGIFIMAIITIIYDYNRRLKVERNLKETEERYRLLVDILPEGIVIHDDNKIFYSNKEALRILGVQNENDFEKYDLSSFLHDDYKEKIFNRVRNTIENNEKNDFLEQKIIRPDGSCLDIEAVGGPINIDGKTLSLSILRDISERKRAEELRNRVEIEENLRKQAIENEKIKTEIFSNFSHELKTPLNLILGTIQLMEVKFKDELISKYSIKNKNPMMIMKQNCFRLLRLVNNILDATRIESGFYGLNLKNVNIVQIVEDITLSVSEYVEQNDVELIFDTDVEEKIIACDPDKIERIILNLLSNAIKFTNPGDIIEVNIEDLNDKIKITVKDNGIGIPEENLITILERFGQVDKHHYRNKQGSGIGLSLVNSLIKMHNGNLTINSEVNNGSEFIIELPVVVLENEEVDDKNLIQNSVERISIEFSDIYS